MTALILGAGRMGKCISYAMKELGYDCVAVDTSDAPLENITGRAVLINDIGTDLLGILKHVEPDIVISSLPYFVNSTAAPIVIANGYRYCDLGGRVDVSKQINTLAKQNNAIVFTDLGLAPGWVNIMAEQGFAELYGKGSDVNVKMMVGGLPDWLISNTNPLRYGLTWSMEGLINEYRDDCIVLEDGEQVTVAGLEGLESVESKNLGMLEAFYTSGGASHTIKSMQDRGVKNCSYKTLRYPGHRDIVKWLMRDCKLDDSAMSDIFNSCDDIAGKDIVVIMATITAGEKTWHKEQLVKADDKFSAMQKATGFAISSVASIMGEGYFDDREVEYRGYTKPLSNVLRYEDVPHKQFNAKIDQLMRDSSLALDAK